MSSWRWLIGVINNEVDEKGNYLDQLWLGQDTSVSVIQKCFVFRVAWCYHTFLTKQQNASHDQNIHHLPVGPEDNKRDILSCFGIASFQLIFILDGHPPIGPQDFIVREGHVDTSSVRTSFQLNFMYVRQNERPTQVPLWLSSLQKQKGK